MENEVMVLPNEVNEIAKGVSDEKKAMVASVLNDVFSGVDKMKKQLDAILVQDENDKTSMALAKTIRLDIRRTRIASEKILDAKRDEVKQQMLSYKTEDQLWLKAKQIMQIMAKEVEELARYKEETAIRIAAEKLEQIKAERKLIASPYAEFIPESIDLGSMSDEDFKKLLDGAKLMKKDKDEEGRRVEAERVESLRLDKLENERHLVILPYRQFWTTDQYNLRNMSDVNFETIVNFLKESKAEHDKKQEEIRIENERLKKEAEERGRKAAEERKKAAAEKEKAAEKARKEREVIEKNAAEEKKRAEEKADKLRKELNAKKEAERKTKEEEERKSAKEKAAKEAAESAPDLDKISSYIKAILNVDVPKMATVNGNKILAVVLQRINRLETDTMEAINNARN